MPRGTKISEPHCFALERQLAKELGLGLGVDRWINQRLHRDGHLLVCQRLRGGQFLAEGFKHGSNVGADVRRLKF